MSPLGKVLRRELRLLAQRHHDAAAPRA